MADLVYDEKGNMRSSSFYTRMNVGGNIIIVPYLETEARRIAITREGLRWDDHTIKSKREETFRRKYRVFSRMRRVLQDLLASTLAVFEYSVCGIPVSSQVRKDVQTVPRRIKLSRAGTTCSKTFTSAADIISLYRRSPR